MLAIGWVAAQQSAVLGAAPLMAYGLRLMVPLAILGTLAATRAGITGFNAEVAQERARLVSGVSPAPPGGFLQSM